MRGEIVSSQITFFLGILALMAALVVLVLFYSGALENLVAWSGEQSSSVADTVRRGINI